MAIRAPDGANKMTRVESLNLVTLFVERSRLRNIEVDITALVRHCQDVAPATVPGCANIATICPIPTPTDHSYHWTLLYFCL